MDDDAGVHNAERHSGPDTDRHRHGFGDADRLGFDENRDYLASAVGKLVPRQIADRAVDVTVSLSASSVGVGESIPFTVTLRNRLPVPIVAATTERRIWGWTVDGTVPTRPEPRREDGGSNVVEFRGGEAKQISRVWNGRFRRTDGGRVRWERASPGTYELRVFATTPNRPSDTTTVEIR